MARKKEKAERKQESAERADRDARRGVVRITLAVPEDVHSLAAEVAAKEFNQTTRVLVRFLSAGADAVRSAMKGGK